MIQLIPLCTMTLELAPSLTVGVGPGGDRSIGAIRAATLVGERLRATLAGPAAGDFLVRTGSVGVIDARLTLRTHDEALIYMSYGGRLDLSDPATGMVAYVAPVFEAGDDRYAWLNALQCVAKGRLTLAPDGGHLAYDICEVR